MASDGVENAIQSTPLIVAHRGASFDAPENTLAAFKLAWEQGADAIEADFRLSRDGRLVCIHDASTTNVASEIRNIHESDWADLRSVDVGSWKDVQFSSERMPSLAEVLATAPEGKLVFIELKEDPALVERFLSELEETDFPTSQLRVISFEPSIIKGLETQRPELITSLLVSFQFRSGAWTPDLNTVLTRAKQVGADAVSLGAKGPLCLPYVQELRKAGLGVHVWTVDQPPLARAFAMIGIDSITTNTPALIRESLVAETVPGAGPPPL